MINVFLTDDHIIFREGLKRIIEENDGMAVVGEAGDGREAINKILKDPPDVAIVDISMPGVDGLEVIARVCHEMPDIPFIILSMHVEPQFVQSGIEAGAAGFVAKQSAPEQLVTAIQSVCSGDRYLCQEASRAIASLLTAGNAKTSPVDLLTQRELQVLRNLALGKTNREIAEIYNISVKTVDTYRLRLLKKLELRNNADLSRFAIQNKLIEL